MSEGWSVERSAGSAHGFHARVVPDDPGHLVWVHDVDAPALVLGSTQRDEVVDRAAAAAAGVEVVRRRSGGGAVLLEPGAQLWVDVVLPRDDPRWDDDVARASHWLGDVWAAALSHLGVDDVVVHRGALVATAWSPLVCFAGVGPGEVMIVPGEGSGGKVVGISQRRTRGWARFQCAALGSWSAESIVGLLALDEARRRAAEVALAQVGWGASVDLDDLLATFLTLL